NPATGAVTYTPAMNYNGPDSFTFIVTDDSTAGGPALTSAPGTFTITVNSVNDSPANLSLVLSAASINENGSTSISGSFTDVEGSDEHSRVINVGYRSAYTHV